MRRPLVLCLLLFLAYATTTGLRAAPGARYSTAEAHRLLTAASLAHDGDVDLRNQYRERTWRAWHGPALRPTAIVVSGRLAEPQGIGFPLLVAPAYVLGGATAVELECALLMALAFTLAAALARRLAPEPWATRGVLAIALSPPVLVASTTVAPVAAGALALTGAALLALRVREEPRMASAVACAALLATTFWLEIRLALPAAVIAVALARWLRRRRRALAAFVALEVVLTSAVVYLTVNDAMFGGPTPAAARLARGPVTGADTAGEYLARVPRLAEVFGDRHAGLLLWAPAVLLVIAGAAVLWHSRRTRLAAAIPAQMDVEVAGLLLVLVGAAGVLAAAFLRRTVGGAWLVVPELATVLAVVAPLAALGLRRYPRLGAALVVLTLAGSVWLVAGARLDDGAGVAPPRGAVPWA